MTFLQQLLNGHTLGLINIQNEDHGFFKWYFVRYLNPVGKIRVIIRKSDGEFSKQLLKT